MAYAQRRTRQDPAFKRGTAYVFYWLLTRLASVDIPRNVGDFRLMDRKVVAEVIRYREHDRFLRGIVAHVGFRQEAVPFDRDPRYAGSSSYPLRHDAEARRRRHPRLLDVPAAADLAAGHADLAAQRAVGALFVVYVRVFEPEQGRARLGLHRGRHVPARRASSC